MPQDARGSTTGPFTTRGLAAVSGYSVQQVRDLERLSVIPPSVRRPNGYRQFTPEHATALRAYRHLAEAVGPVLARATMREMRDLPYDEAVARIVALHVQLSRARDDTLAALHALEVIVDESAHEAAADAGDMMSIAELSAALGVRSSTLRFWEQQGLIASERPTGSNVRHFGPAAVGDARIVVALRGGGYGIPAVQAVMSSLHTVSGTGDARRALHDRLQNIATRSEALLMAGTDLAELLRRSPDTAPAARQDQRRKHRRNDDDHPASHRR